MARVSRSREEKTRFVAAWRVSGIGLHRFARENRISPKSLREWMALEASPPAFLPVAVVERAGGEERNHERSSRRYTPPPYRRSRYRRKPIGVEPPSNSEPHPPRFPPSRPRARSSALRPCARPPATPPGPRPHRLPRAAPARAAARSRSGSRLAPRSRSCAASSAFRSMDTASHLHRRPASVQFPNLAVQLVYGHLSHHFAGPGHCAGCQGMQNAADGHPKLGSAEAWRRLGTIHHLTRAVQTLQGLTWP